MKAKSVCEQCGNSIGYSEGVHLAHDEGDQLLCYECFNAFMSRQMDFDFEHPRFLPISMDDIDGNSHRFEFRTMLCGDVVTLRAVETRDDGREGYEILIYGDPEDDPMLLFQRLYEQMSRELKRRHLIDSDLGPQICDDNVVRARITWDSEYDGHVPLLVVDGREISWREFGRMLMTYEGWNFKLDIFDSNEEG